MDKPRWLVTWVLSASAADVAGHNDSLWWVFLKVLPFALAAVVIEQYRSYRQNQE
jgi:hypothetical protein